MFVHVAASAGVAKVVQLEVFNDVSAHLALRCLDLHGLVKVKGFFNATLGEGNTIRPRYLRLGYDSLSLSDHIYGQLRPPKCLKQICGVVCHAKCQHARISFDHDNLLHVADLSRLNEIVVTSEEVNSLGRDDSHTVFYVEFPVEFLHDL